MSNRRNSNNRMRSMRRVRRTMKSRSKSMPDLSLYPFPGILETFVMAIRDDNFYVAALALGEMLKMVLYEEPTNRVVNDREK